MVLRDLRQAGHPPRAPERHGRQDPAALLQRQAQLAGHRRTPWSRPSTSSGSKEKFGRAVGYGLHRDRRLPLEPGQRLHEAACPDGLWKLEVEPHLLGQLLRLREGRLLRHRLRPLRPRRHRQTYTFDYDQGEAIGSYQLLPAIRPQKTVNVDGSYFFEGLGGNHELKFGFGYRETSRPTPTPTTAATSSWAIINSADDKIARLHRDGSAGAIGKYLSFYVGGRVHEGPALTQPRGALRPAEGQERRRRRAGQRVFPERRPLGELRRRQ